MIGSQQKVGRASSLSPITLALGALVAAGVSVAQPAQSAARQPPPPCAQFLRFSGHTDRVRWYHCHSTSSAYTKRVHICGDSGTLHGISVVSLPDGIWFRTKHRHDRGGEGCRPR